MSSKRVKVHQLLHNNQDLIQKLHQMYDRTNYTEFSSNPPSVIQFLKDVDSFRSAPKTAKKQKGKEAQNDSPIISSLETVLHEDFNQLTSAGLVSYCKTEKSLAMRFNSRYTASDGSSLE